MDFNFLPQLPSSRLDDRGFDDLVEECLLRIPRYCPEWTDHNLSDPGVTLVELFSWLTDQMLMRFNQVPRKNYIAFLELLGIQLQPPTPAQTMLTFYLSTPLQEQYVIPEGTEVATERTETQEAIAFSTTADLIIGQPKIKHFLSALNVEETPEHLHDQTALWQSHETSFIANNEVKLFPQKPQSGNCAYFVFDPEEPLAGNVLTLNFGGAQGAPTGINPKHPPRCWQAWNGDSWVGVLLSESDDTTHGFSFNEGRLEEDLFDPTGDVTLHLPESWPEANFAAYRGCWLRCVITASTPHQPGYSNPPRLKTLTLYAIGGSVQSSQCIFVHEELLGTSDGKPGQNFPVASGPILDRQEGESLLVIPPGKPPEIWEEVKDFADSGPGDRHFMIDSLAGTIQFGPLVREPQTLKRRTQNKGHGNRFLPQGLASQDFSPGHELRTQMMEHQYGAIPPRGAEIVFSYRTGGGKQGNVQAGTLNFLKSAMPYVARVTNLDPAVNGADAESLDQAVIRAPQILRSHDRAVTASDFEALTIKGSGGAIARSKCLPHSANQPAGSVSILVVPQANIDLIDQGLGLSPEQFNLNPVLKDQVLNYLDARRLLGVQVLLQQPEYIGVSVQLEVALEPTYQNAIAQKELIQEIEVDLYDFLNPITGGVEGEGWPLGRPLYPSDIMAFLQQKAGIQYLGAILLFPILQIGHTWQRQSTLASFIDPGPLGIFCSWASTHERTGHRITVLSTDSGQRG